MNRDKGSTLVAPEMPEIYYKNLSKENFAKFYNRMGEMTGVFRNMNLKNITDFYFNETRYNMSDSGVVQQQMFNFFGDVFIKCPTYRFAKRYAEQSKPASNIIFYELTYTLSEYLNGQYVGVAHGAEIPFVFGQLLLEPKTISAKDIEFSENVMKLWTDFAKYG